MRVWREGRGEEVDRREIDRLHKCNKWVFVYFGTS